MKNSEIKAIFKKIEVFGDFSDELLTQVAEISSYKKMKLHEMLIHEGSAANHIYIIVKGRFSIFKPTQENSTLSAEFGLLQPGDIVGELSFLDGQPRSANVKSIDENSKVIEIPFTELEKLMPVHFYRKLAKRLSYNIRTNNQVIVENLKKELERNKKLANMGRYIIYILILISFYDLSLRAFSSLATNPYTMIFASTSVIAIFTIVLTIMIYQMGYPFSNYGLNLNNWQTAIKESLFFSAIAIIIITGIKWLAIKFWYPNLTLFSDMHFLVPPEIIGTHKFYIWIGVAIVVYGIFALLQEFIARGILQGSLQNFLHFKHNDLWANIVTTVVFSAMHIHLPSNLAFVLFLPSLFWGWLYSRHRTLLSPAISHILIGWWAIFALGIEKLLS